MSARGLARRPPAHAAAVLTRAGLLARAGRLSRTGFFVRSGLGACGVAVAVVAAGCVTGTPTRSASASPADSATAVPAYAMRGNPAPAPAPGEPPRVFRCVLDRNARMLVASFGPGLWAAFDTTRAELVRVWSGGVDLDGPVYTTRHGPQPTAHGLDWRAPRAGARWRLVQDGLPAGDWPELAATWLGHELIGEAVLLRSTLALPDGDEVLVEELLAAVPLRTAAPRGTAGATPRAGAAPPASATPPASAMPSTGATSPAGAAPAAVALANTIEVSRAGSGALREAGALPALALVRDDGDTGPVVVARFDGVGSSTLVARFDAATATPFPAPPAVAAAGASGASAGDAVDDAAAPSGVAADEPVGLPAAADAFVDAPVAPTAPDAAPLPPPADDLPRPAPIAEPGPLEPGLALRLYLVDAALPQLAPLVAGQTPNVSVVVPSLDLDSERGDFEPLLARAARAEGSSPDPDPQFVAHASGFLRVETDGVYGLRLVSDDGSRLRLGGALLVDHDGLHSASPKDGWAFLRAGLHALAVEHFEYGGGERLSLLWLPPGTERFVPVPTEALACPAGEVRVTSPGPKRLVRPLQKGRPGDGAPLDAVHPSFTLTSARPEDFHPAVGGMDFLPDGRLAICTWDAEGAVWILDGVTGGARITATKFADGLAEPLGLRVVDGRIFVLQKQELTELVDRDGDGTADVYRCIAAGWPTSANFHEFAFGLAHHDGALWAALAIAIDPGGRSTQPQVAGRGSVLRVALDGGGSGGGGSDSGDDGGGGGNGGGGGGAGGTGGGEPSGAAAGGSPASQELVAHGLRTPNGIGRGAGGHLYITDNQGDWLPVSKLLRVERGAFYGSRAVLGETAAGLAVTPPVAWLPQGEIGNSPSEPVPLEIGPWAPAARAPDGGAVGGGVIGGGVVGGGVVGGGAPAASDPVPVGHMLHGDVTHGGLKRVFVEEVDGVAQGTVFRFSQGFEAGVNRVVWGPDGALYVGGIGSTGNWGQEGKLRYGLQRLAYTGAPVFEPLAVSARSDGFRVELTQPVDPSAGLSPEDWLVTSWRYEPTSDYGGEKLDVREHEVVALGLDASRRAVELRLDGFEGRAPRPVATHGAEAAALAPRRFTGPRTWPGMAGRVVHIRAPHALRDADGRALWTTEAWYTLNRVPADRPLAIAPEGIAPPAGSANSAAISTAGDSGTEARLSPTAGSAAPAETMSSIPTTSAGTSAATAWSSFAPPPPPPPNTLTDAERAAGWRLLFDGETTAGWNRFGARARANALVPGVRDDNARPLDAPDGWEVYNGALARLGPGGDIATDEEFGDFELRLEWRIAPGGNSGIFFRANDEEGAVWRTGPEMQVLDNDGHADGASPLTSAGANYALHAPAWDTTLPPGRWNAARLLVRGTHVEHWLNGAKLLEYELGSPDWEQRVADSKFASMPRYGREPRGRIALQDHGDRVEYRSISIREL